MLSLQFCLSICPVETAVGFILEEFPAVVFPLSSHTHVLGQGWVLHPISSCPLCGRAGRTKGSVVCPLSLKRGAVVPSAETLVCTGVTRDISSVHSPWAGPQS